MKIIALIVIILSFSLLIGWYCTKSKPRGFPILMYHDIGEKGGRFCVTPENFRRHLQALYDAGFVTSRLDNIISHRSTPSDKKQTSTRPVVLRFDDSRKSQFKLIRDQKGSLIIDPNCALGILLDFAKTHPGFGTHAVFCVIATEQFHQPRYAKQKLLYLLDNGMEIINHTFDHELLLDATPEGVDEAFGKAMEVWEALLGSRAQEITFIAPPCGVLPRSARTRNRLKNYVWNNKHYKPSGILCAGRRYHIMCPPSDSPSFNPFELPSFDVTNDNFDDILATIKTFNS
jgi:hypothetical protein